MAAASVGDRGEHQVQGFPVKAGDVVTQVDLDVTGSDRGGDPQESLLSPGQGVDVVADAGEVDPVAGLGRLDPGVAGLGEPAGEGPDEQLVAASVVYMPFAQARS